MNPDPLDEILAASSATRSDFYPVGSLSDKRNYKRFLRIGRDGLIRESVHLDVPDDRLREEIICIHYMRHLVRNFLKADTGVKILGRDCPWDFELQLSSGETFFLEITSIADSTTHFEINKREERLAKSSNADRIPFHELRKLERHFPSEAIAKQISDYEREQVAPNDLVANPFATSSTHVLISGMHDPEASLGELLRTAIEKKSNKRHDGKQATVLVVDNRTIAFDLEHYIAAARELEAILEEIPFPEVWFYTGYCSDNDGSNAEFGFAPLKATEAQTEVLAQMEVDSTGRHVW